jgi:anthraniloyl-CoA monooxygenase
MASRGLNILVVGAGPAGLYLAILMKKQNPAHAVTLLERDGPDDTFGWGIVFSERTLAVLRDTDPETHRAIVAGCETWDDVAVVHRGREVRVGGNRFYGIARLAFLNLLHARARALGAEIRFHANVAEAPDPAGWDLLVGADGANSLIRRAWADFFLPSVDLRQNRYVWLGTAQRFDALRLAVHETPAGLFITHAYRFSPTRSTFIVECPPETWLRAGLDRLSPEETCASLARVFEDDLGGHSLLSNNFVKWLNFPLIRNKRWHHRNVVLLGDALHTAHFSIGSGTKLALEDAVALAGCFALEGTVEAALPAFERVRRPVVEAFQEAAFWSLRWLEGVHEHLHLDPLPFAYRVVTRSRRLGRNQLKQRDPAFIARYDRWRQAHPPRGPLPEEFLDLFAKPTYAHLATLMPDGTPQVTSVWVDFDGAHILVNSAKGRQKDRNMAERPEVAIEIPDPEDPNRYLAVRGRVVEITEEGADEHLDRLARRYLGRDRYPPGWRLPGEVRRIYKILPERVTPWAPFR